jgi:hypothetical protein
MGALPCYAPYTHVHAQLGEWACHRLTLETHLVFGLNICAEVQEELHHVDVALPTMTMQDCPFANTREKRCGLQSEHAHRSPHGLEAERRRLLVITAGGVPAVAALGSGPAWRSRLTFSYWPSCAMSGVSPENVSLLSSAVTPAPVTRRRSGSPVVWPRHNLPPLHRHSSSTPSIVTSLSPTRTRRGSKPASAAYSDEGAKCVWASPRA